MQPDPQTLSTVIRDGNYDFLTNSQRWHNTPGGFTIPNSMYLASKPAFFGTNQWPWVDPSTGTINTLPAKARYDAGTPNVVGTSDPRATNTALSSSQNPSVFGASVTFTTTVTAASGTPSGTVTFKDGATTLGAGTLAAGAATFSTSALAIGSHTITAVYGGDTNFNGSTSVAVTQTVADPRTTTTGLSSSQNPSVSGASVTFTTTVTAASGTPTGTVTFMDGATTLGTGTLSAGVATFSISSLAIGGHTITAVYGGDTNFTGSTSSGLTQTVNQVAAAPTVSAVNPNAGTSAGGTSVTITGSNFTGATAVSFGGTAAASFTVVSATSITATSPAHAAGAVDVRVTTPNGTSATSASDTFTYAAGSTITIGETTITPNSDSGNANLLLAQQASLSQTATIQSMSFYVTAAAGNQRLGIYDATGPGGGPGTKIAETAEITPVVGWNTANVTSQVSLPAGTYWLAYLPSSNSLGFTNASTGSTKYYSLTYGALPTAFSTTPNSGTFHFSFYATLIPGLANTPTTTALSSSQNPSVFGQSVTFTATVARPRPPARRAGR